MIVWTPLQSLGRFINLMLGKNFRIGARQYSAKLVSLGVPQR